MSDFWIKSHQLDEFFNKHKNNINLKDIPKEINIAIKGETKRPVMLLDEKHIKKFNSFFCITFKGVQRPIKREKNNWILASSDCCSTSYQQKYLSNGVLKLLREKVKTHSNSKEYKIETEVKELRLELSIMTQEYNKLLKPPSPDNENDLASVEIFYQEDLKNNSWQKLKIVKRGHLPSGTLSSGSELAKSVIGKSEKQNYKYRKGRVTIHKL